MISLVVLWHMHQPEYADPSTGEYALPWTRLHAVKDYDEFADVLADHPDIHMTVNMTPVLCAQLEALAAGRMDVYAAITEKPAAYLTQLEREFILSNFFKANFETMIRPYERYAELYFERGIDAPVARIHEMAKSFSTQKMRDLQVWANLAWSSLRLRTSDPVVRELLAKGQNYTEEEKLALMAVHRSVCTGILKKYKTLEDNGIAELSSTPYYHPILPVLLDMNDAQAACPGLVLPNETRPFEDDARWHVEEALAHSERTFGRRPVGMWPAEGSVSEKALDLLASCGVKWAATDERILEKSLEGSGTRMSPQALARFYKRETPHGPVHLFFRNHELSDRIGFTYAGRPTADAAADFVAGVRAAAAGTDSPVVTVILDGENAWEAYRGATCRPFLTDFFSAIRQAEISTKTCAQCVSTLEAAPLAKLSPGSWINGNFNIWIGHPEDNTGWDAVQAVRQSVERMPPGSTRLRAEQLLRIAEGSDWYWWFGDDHSSQDDPMFDRLFRENLASICKLAGVQPPKEIMEPIKRSQGISIAKQVTESFSPTVDGRIRPFYEWLAAGRVDISYIAGAMHKAVYHLERMFWGFDESSVYFCLEMADLPDGAEVQIHFRVGDAEFTACVPTSAGANVGRLEGVDEECSISCAFGEVLEVAVPLSALNLSQGKTFMVSISVQVEDMEIERWPVGKNMELFVPDAAFFSSQWIV